MSNTILSTFVFKEQCQVSCPHTWSLPCHDFVVCSCFSRPKWHELNSDQWADMHMQSGENRCIGAVVNFHLSSTASYFSHSSYSGSSF